MYLRLHDKVLGQTLTFLIDFQVSSLFTTVFNYLTWKKIENQPETIQVRGIKNRISEGEGEKGWSGEGASDEYRSGLELIN